MSRSAYRPFPVQLTGRTQLSENFVRLTFADPSLSGFADVCLDQRIKLVFGTDAQLDEAAAAESWIDWWRDQPNESRPVMRTYTSRFVRKEAGEVDVDFVVHGTDGPASRFALEAQLGDRLVIVGADADHPEAGTQGLTWRGGDASSVLLIGDETALPAIANILRSLPAHVTGAAFLEVASPADAIELDTAAEVPVTYLPRSASAAADVGAAAAVGAGAGGGTAVPDNGGHTDAARGEQLVAAVCQWLDERGARIADDNEAAQADATVADPTTTETGILWEEGAEGTDLRVWVAADAFTVRKLRHALLRERGYDRKSCSFMGYWKPGAREGE